jgi:N-acylneuraminate cytidylyltransferase
MDFDGVLTDDRVHVDETGREAVACSRSDGMGLSRLVASGVGAVILSSERNPVVSARAAKLRIESFQGVDDKGAALARVAADRNLAMEEVAYVGNDVNDMACMAMAGVSVAVADAHPEVLRAAAIVLRRPGGHGAVRELCDEIVQARNREARSD